MVHPTIEFRKFTEIDVQKQIKNRHIIPFNKVVTKLNTCGVAVVSQVKGDLAAEGAAFGDLPDSLATPTLSSASTRGFNSSHCPRYCSVCVCVCARV